MSAAFEVSLVLHRPIPARKWPLGTYHIESVLEANLVMDYRRISSNTVSKTRFYLTRPQFTRGFSPVCHAESYFLILENDLMRLWIALLDKGNRFSSLRKDTWRLSASKSRFLDALIPLLIDGL